MNTDDNAKRVIKMWEELGDKIAAELPEIVKSGDIDRALKWAMCADACFYQATGEANAPSVLEIIFPRTNAQL